MAFKPFIYLGAILTFVFDCFLDLYTFLKGFLTIAFYALVGGIVVIKRLWKESLFEIGL